MSNILSQVGNFVDFIGEKIIELLPQTLLQSPNIEKIISLFVYGLIIWAVLHFAVSLKPIVKFGLVVLLGLFILSLIFSINL